MNDAKKNDTTRTIGPRLMQTQHQLGRDQQKALSRFVHEGRQNATFRADFDIGKQNQARERRAATSACVPRLPRWHYVPKKPGRNDPVSIAKLAAAEAKRARKSERLARLVASGGIGDAAAYRAKLAAHTEGGGDAVMGRRG